ncbi:uncharacterized protein LOC118199631 [Stegodyphus dumicola]|uniref:uncharacterized protein LOC118199631 n=1 Tax=Stegodyphus dumicola TaxID=202533 RepID=UPI0015B116CC|nr:uncharacterized protein LOC118199631 [Stegodyphus dumicola]
MLVIFFTSVFLFFPIVLSQKPASDSGICHYVLHVENDGPVTLDVPVTISAKLDCASNEDEYFYIFEDDIQRTVQIPGQGSAEAVFIFTDDPGTRMVTVLVFQLSPSPKRVAAGNTFFNVFEYIPGSLHFSSAVINRNNHLIVTTGERTNISLEVQYPTRVLKDSEFSYSWSIEETRFTTTVPYKIHVFNETGTQLIRGAVVARVPSYDGTNSSHFKWGYFDGELIAKDPFTNFNISGNTYLQHGQLLDLDITCNGSGPVDYCWKILPPKENETNLSCIEPVSANECSFPIIYYFHESGDYMLAIYVDNLVSSVQRNIEIHIYDVSLRPQLSTVIIPVVCTVLVVLIIAGAVVVHLRRQTSYDVETADFDFMTPDEPNVIAIETSWEIMRRSLLQLLQMRSFYCTSDGATLTNYGTILRTQEEINTNSAPLNE